MTHEKRNPGACKRRGSGTAVLFQSSCPKPTAARHSLQGHRMPLYRPERMRDLIGSGP